MIKLLLLLAVAAFVGYAVVVHFNKTDPALSTPKRVWAALVAAAGALALLVQQMLPFHG